MTILCGVVCTEGRQMLENALNKGSTPMGPGKPLSVVSVDRFRHVLEVRNMADLIQDI